MTKCPETNCCKRIKLTDLSCRCGNTYCSTHRLPETHDCSYNFKLNNKEMDVLKEQMKCTNQKIIKI